MNTYSCSVSRMRDAESLPTPRRPRIGIVGGGQLARMTVQAATTLGVLVTVLDPDPNNPAVGAGAEALVGDPSDLGALRTLAGAVDVVTFDHERVPLAHLRVLESEGVHVAPGSAMAEMAFDKSAARHRFSEEGFPIPDFVDVRTAADIVAFAASTCWPVVVKSSRGGYDGRGVALVASQADAVAAADLLGPTMIAEEFVRFDQELAILVARGHGGETVAYPPVTTVQADGMCVEVSSPADVLPELAGAAQELAISIANRLGLVGVMAVELFVADGRLVVNEVATRPHNTGHHTIEANETSQFEQHVRAILGLPLGSTTSRSRASVMCNVVGGPDGSDPSDRLPVALAVPGAHVHLYGKHPRPGRKLGHVTALGSSTDEARAAARLAADLLTGAPVPAGAGK